MEGFTAKFNIKYCRSIFLLIFAAFYCAGCSVQQTSVTEIDSVSYTVYNQKDDEKKAKALWRMGSALCASGDFRGAIGRFLEALNLGINDADLYNELGLAYMQIGEYEESLVYLKKTTSMRFDFSPAYNNMGTAYFLLKDYDNAINSFNMALKNTLYATPQLAYHNMGWTYFEKGDVISAIKNYEKALVLDPYYSLCRIKLGLAYEKVGDPTKAFDSYSKALELTPGYAPARFSLYKLYYSFGMVEKAINELNLIIEENPKTAIADEARKAMNNIIVQ